MSIVNTNWILEGLGGGVGFDNQTQNESCKIEFSETINTVADAVRLSGFRTGQEHRFNKSLSIDGEVQATAIDGVNWQFDLTYSSQATINNPSDNDNDFRPIIKPLKWKTQEVITHDKKTGEPIENPAGDPYDPPFMADINYPGFRITLRESSANLGRYNLIGSINSAAAKIAGVSGAKYCIQFADYNPNANYDEEDNLYFLNDFDILFNFKKAKDGTVIGYQKEVLAQGFNQLITASDKTGGSRPIMENNEPVATMKKLGANGQVTTTAYYERKVVHDLISFSALGLPTNYPSF